MRMTRQPARINVKALVILVVATGLLGGGAVVGHYVRKRMIAEDALSAGKVALEREDWAEACKHLRLYLSKYPDDVQMLEEYAEARLAIRPLEPGNVGAAIGAYRRVLRHRPGDAQICKELAKLYFLIRDYSEVAYVCRKRLEADASDAAAMLWLAKALIAQRKHDEATDVLEKMVEQHPDEVKAHGFLSALAMQEDSVSAKDTALYWLDRAVEASPESPEARVQRARFRRLVLKEGEAAREDLQAADTFQPVDPSVRLMLASEWLSWGDFDRTQVELDAVGQVDADMLARFDIDPDVFALTRFSVEGRLLLRRRAEEEGANQADRALAQLPERLQSAFLPLAVELYLAAGRVADARAALEEYRDAVQARSDTMPSSDERLAPLDAAVAGAEGRPYAVIALLEDLVVGQPQLAPGWKLLGEAYEKTGQARRALTAFEQYMRHAPGDREMTLKLAKAYRRRDWGKALRYATNAAQMRPDDLEAKLLSIEAQLNFAAVESTKADRFRPFSAKLASLCNAHPDVARIRILQAELAAYEGRVNDAIGELEGAVNECERKLSAALALAQYCRRVGRLEKAMEVCRQAIELRPDSALPRVLLAELLMAADQKEDARDTLEKGVADLAGQERMTVQGALAQFALLNDMREGGIALLKELAAEHADNVQLRIALLQLPEVTGEAEEAQKLVDELKRLEGEQGLLWQIEQANVWLRSKEWRERRQQIEDMLTHCVRTDPGWSAPVLALGRMYELLGQDNKAEEAYRRAVGSYPEELDVVSRLLALLERQRRFTEATAVLDRMPDSLPSLSAHRVDTAIGRGDYEAAIEELQRRIAADPNDAASRVILARLVYGYRKDVDGAFKLLDEAKAVAPDLLAVASSSAAILHAEDRRDEAVALLDSEVLRRNDFAAYQLRAEYWVSTGRADLAEKDYAQLTNFLDAAGNGHAALGRFYQRQGKIDEAIAAWDAGLDAYPNNTGLQKLLVKALVTHPQVQARKRGRVVLDGLLKGSPDDVELLSVWASVLADEHTPQATRQATATLERVVELDPHNVGAHLQLIELAREGGDLNEAGKWITRALGANPQNAVLILVRAKLEATLGNIRVARELAQSALGIDPKSVPARNVLSGLARRVGEIESAQVFNDEALKLDPGNEVAQVARAGILDAKGGRDEAVRNLESFRQTNEGRRGVATLLTLAELYRKQGKFAAAGERIEEAAQLTPNNRAVPLERLRWLAAQDRFDDVLADLAGRRVGDPRESSALLLGAKILASTGLQGYVREARSLFADVAGVEPNRVDAHLGLAQVGYQLGEVDVSERAYRRILELNPYHRQALNDLAWILEVDLGRPEEALELADMGVARYPDDPHLLDTRGVVLTGLDRLTDARKDLERCLAVVKDVPATRARALLHLARVCAKQGESPTARMRLDEALQIDRQHNVLTSAERAEIAELISSRARHLEGEE